MHYLNYKQHGLLHPNFSSSVIVLSAPEPLRVPKPWSLALQETCLNKRDLCDVPPVASSRNGSDSTLTCPSSRNDLQWAALCRRWRRKSSSGGTPDPWLASLSLWLGCPGDTVHIFAKKTSCLKEDEILYKGVKNKKQDRFVNIKDSFRMAKVN